MPRRHHIPTIFFLGIILMVQLHPLFITYELAEKPTQAKTGTCTRTPTPKPACPKSKCTLPLSATQPEDCNNNGCTPCVPCIAICCFIPASALVYAHPPFDQTREWNHVDDNRLASTHNDYWRPPRPLS